jgi:thioredoxin reductase (NADPH)
VVEIIGKEGVESVRLAAADGAVEVLACSGVFIFVGLTPNVGYLPNELARDAQGFVVTDSSLRTNLLGIYAIGAVRAGYSGQLAQAAGEAVAAVAAIPATSHI